MGRIWGGGKRRPRWSREIADDQLWQARYAEPEATIPAPQHGDIVLKPIFDSASLKQGFRVETWNTHALLDGPFPRIREALEAALEMAVTAKLAVWVDYSEDPEAHELEDAPVYFAERGGSPDAL